jgi:hypothetical protein
VIDPIRPPEYGGPDDPYEAVKVIRAWKLPFTLGNVLKYVRRAQAQEGPEAVETLRKAWT